MVTFVADMKRILDYSILITTVGLMGTACENKPAKPGNHLTDSTQENPAITLLKEAVKQYPDSVRLYDKLIDQYTAVKNYKAAVAWCDSLLSKNEDLNYSYWFVKGDLQRQALQFDSAISSYKKYLQRFPDDEQVLLNLANTAAEAGKPESLALSDELANRTGTNEIKSDAQFIKGVYYSRTGDFDKAIEHFDQTIVYRYSFWEAWLEKAMALYDKKAYDKALETLNKLLQVNPSYPDAFYWLGKCYEALNNKTEALKNYETAYGLDRTYTEAKEKMDSIKAIH